MLRNRLANMLLYVPFNEEYPVPVKIQEALTIEEFYNECYYNPNFDKEIEFLRDLSDEELEDLDYPISRDSMISTLEDQRDEEKSLVTWIRDNGTGVYCIAGDAGTGKSTFVHHLCTEFDEYSWDVLDLQKAVQKIKIMEYNLEFKRFHTLRDKILSTIIGEIISALFIKKPEKYEYDYRKTRKSINELLSFYNNYCSRFHPSSDVAALYNNLNEVRQFNNVAFCSACAEIFKKYFSHLCNKGNPKTILSYVFEHYFIFLRYANSNQKHIVVFDNLERYIGTDEIYNDQIVSFFSQLREIRDNYSKQYDMPGSAYSVFARNFQFIVAIRRTSIRMFTPQQNSDFIQHKVDISEWFAIDKIIEKKIIWYQKHAELLEEGDFPNFLSNLQYILADQGRTGDILRGLHLKLNLLFNNDKRLIVDFLISVLKSPNNSKYLKIAYDYKDNVTISESLRKFVYRSIIWRLVFNKFRSGEWIQNIFTYGDVYKIMAELDYARKILTILSNCSFERREAYISFYELLAKLYPQVRNLRQWFWSDGCQIERSKISRMLFSMNYYDRRENNWFQFIDIQCNSQAINKKHLSDSNKFEDYLFRPEVTKEMRIQITTSGKAYLGYIVQSFEFISCIFEEYPPLLCTLPTQEDLMNYDVDSLMCVKIATAIAERSKTLIQNVVMDNNYGCDVLYKKSKHAEGISYADRIRNAHQGYLSNFCEVFDKGTTAGTEEIKRKKEEVIGKLKKISTSY